MQTADTRSKETEIVRRWILNDEALYTAMQAIVADAHDAIEAGDELCDLLEDQNPLADEPAVFLDLLNHALQSVDWFDLAESFIALQET